MEKVFLLNHLKKSRMLSHIYVFTAVVVSFVFFDAVNMSQAFSYIKAMFGADAYPLLTLASWLLPSRDFSDSERRKLAQRPALSLEVISDGSFMTGFEKYTLDQFPLRNQFRTLKAYTIYHVFGQLDNYDIYIKDGYAAKLEYPLHTDSLEHATDQFEYIYEKYLMDKKIDISLLYRIKAIFLLKNMDTSPWTIRNCAI